MQKLYIANQDYETCAESPRTCHFVYAHGSLEEKARFDIVAYSGKDGFDFRTDRIEDVIAVLPDGEEINAKLFFWHDAPYDEDSRIFMERDPVYRCHGRVIACDDTESLREMEKKMEV